MRRTRLWILGVVMVGAAFVLAPAVAEAEGMNGAENLVGKFGLGFRVGPGFTSQSVNSDFDVTANTGPVLSANALFGVAKWLVAGMNLEAQTHSSNIGSQFTVISFLPFVEFRPIKFGQLSPYATLGIGVNSNIASEDDRGFEYDPSSTFAARIGAGADYFLTKNVALNTELAWKSN